MKHRSENLAEVYVGHDYEHASMFGICDPHLLSVQHPVVPVLLGAGFQSKCISATAGLRETVATNLKLCERLCDFVVQNVSIIANEVLTSSVASCGKYFSWSSLLP